MDSNKKIKKESVGIQEDNIKMEQDLMLLYRAVSRIFINKMIKRQITNPKRVKPGNT